MAINKTNSTVNINELLQLTTEFDILSYYVGIEKVPCIIKSPIRMDKNPSFGIYSLDGVKMYYTDLSTGEKGGTFDLLTKLFNLPLQDVIKKVYSDLSKFKNNVSNINLCSNTDTGQRKKIHKEEVELSCKVREWKDYDVAFWNKYGISLDWLKFGDVYPISHMFFTKNNETKVVRSDKYAYAYLEQKDGCITFKFYQPFNNRFKWINNHNSSVWDLWSKLPQSGNILIITSSRKDALCIWENTSIPSVSLQAESNVPKETVINELKNRFKQIFVLYDNDFESNINHGRNLGKTICDKFGLTQIEIPELYKSKDSSDLVKNHGRSELKKIINQLIK